VAAKTSWHRYGTKLRHCHPNYSVDTSVVVSNIQVKKAFFALVENNVHAAALWDSNKQDIVGAFRFSALVF